MLADPTSQLLIHPLQKSCTDLTGLPRPYLRSYISTSKSSAGQLFLPLSSPTAFLWFFQTHAGQATPSCRGFLPVPKMKEALDMALPLFWDALSPIFVWHKLHIPLYLDFHMPPQKGRRSARCPGRTPQLSSVSQCCSYAQQWIQFIIITWLFPCCLHEDGSYTATPASQCLKLSVCINNQMYKKKSRSLKVIWKG